MRGPCRGAVGDDRPPTTTHHCLLATAAAAATQHRSLGVHISYVRSVTMDSWKDKEIQLMRCGGNKKMRDFFDRRDVPNNHRISAKYNTPDAGWYREKLKAEVEGRPAPPEPAKQAMPADGHRGDPNGKERLTGESDNE